MNKFYASCIAIVLAAATFSVSAADMTSQEQSELRTRAERLQSERQRNPSWDGGRMTDSRDMRAGRHRDDMKKTTVKKTKAKKHKKSKRHVKKTASKTHGKSQRAQ
jgi:hypothetical protein